MINTIKKVIKNLVKPFSKSKSEVKSKVPSQIESNYIGIPAPVVSPDDSWFGSSFKTEKAIEYVQKKNEELYLRLAKEPKQKESKDIHEQMYQKTASSWNSWQENVGGSENFHEGQNSWNSGTGLNQIWGNQ